MSVGGGKTEGATMSPGNVAFAILALGICGILNKGGITQLCREQVSP